jgi:hypothetical protein
LSAHFWRESPVYRAIRCRRRKLTVQFTGVVVFEPLLSCAELDLGPFFWTVKVTIHIDTCGNCFIICFNLRKSICLWEQMGLLWRWFVHHLEIFSLFYFKDSTLFN